MLEGDDRYLQRKYREASLINRCLAAPLEMEPPASPGDVIDQKFQLAAALRAERSLQSWAVTETARSEMKRWASGPFRFNFGYQRADLAVHGPAVYKALCGSSRATSFQKTIYTGSGMSAIAGLFTSLLRLHERIEVLTPRGCYGETRELMKSLGKRVGIIPREGWHASTRRPDAPLRVLLLDSCVSGRFLRFLDLSPQDFDLVLFDTTCFWRGSSRIDIAIRWARRSGLPLALVRSHAKLDCLGVEYGRLGSIVLVATCDGKEPKRSQWASDLAREIRDSVRLFGAAPIPSHFPPFSGASDYDDCSIARTVSIMRNTRQLYGLLVNQPRHQRIVTTFQHGLYLTLSPGINLRMKDAKHAAAGLCDALVARGLPVKHAGSFGFDFVAIEWFPDPISRRNVIRVAPGDLPTWLMNEIATGIDQWWSAQRTTITPGEARRRPRPSIRQCGGIRPSCARDTW